MLQIPGPSCEAVIAALLNRKMPEDLSHIRGLKDRQWCVVAKRFNPFKLPRRYFTVQRRQE